MSRENFEHHIVNNTDWSIQANYTSDGTFVSYIRDDVQDCWEAWQACELEQSKRIAELEKEVALLNKVAENASREIGELETENAELAEALKILVSRIKLFDNLSDGGLSQHDNSVSSAESLIAKVNHE